MKKKTKSEGENVLHIKSILRGNFINKNDDFSLGMKNILYVKHFLIPETHGSAGNKLRIITHTYITIYQLILISVSVHNGV